MDTADIRHSNSQQVLRLLWKIRQVSRADLARMTGLSRPSISTLVEEFIEQGLVSEVGFGQSNGGRRPVLLRFEDDARSLLGIELGRSSVKTLLCNLRGEEIAWWEDPVATAEDPLATLEVILAQVNRASLVAQERRSSILGLGLGLPSPVFSQWGAESLHPTIFPQWKGFQLQKALQEELRLPVWVGNDANLGALAELWWHAEQPLQHLVYLQLGDGLGAGIVLGGKIFSGSHGLAGEIGHARLSSEASRSLSALSFNELLKQDSSRELSADTLTILSSAIAQAILNWDPQMLVLGGSWAQWDTDRIESLQKAVRAHLVWPELQGIPIQTSLFGERQTALGAATLVLEKFLEASKVLLLSKNGGTDEKPDDLGGFSGRRIISVDSGL